MTLEREIKQFGSQQGADLVGIASVADINRYAPPGYRPDDILTGAKSVVVFAKRGLIRGAWRSPDYRTLYYNAVWGALPGIAMAIAGLIESKYGYYSLAKIPPSIGLYPSLSQKLCAEMAGLGTRSMAASILLNRELGILHVGTCITTMPLVADGPMKEPVCPHPSCVKLWERKRTIPCLETCPECLSGELEDGRIKWMRYDRRICSTRAHTVTTDALLRILLDSVNQSDPEMRRNILLGSFSRNVINTTITGIIGHCYECVRHCPICIRANNLKPRNRTPV
ncbi:hypothetical protein ES703_21734 [subsurface metagenome]